MRYRNNKKLIDENGIQYINRSEYPVIPVRDNDIIIRGVLGQRFDQLAHTHYNNQELWWIIARANGQLDGSTYMVPGKEYRIPQDIARIIEDFEELNR